MMKQMLNLIKAILKISFLFPQELSNVLQVHHDAWTCFEGLQVQSCSNRLIDGKEQVERKEFSSYPEFTDLKSTQKILFPLVKQILLALGKFYQG